MFPPAWHNKCFVCPDSSAMKRECPPLKPYGPMFGHCVFPDVLGTITSDTELECTVVINNELTCVNRFEVPEGSADDLPIFVLELVAGM